MQAKKLLKRSQVGLTLLEVIISLTIISAAMLGLNSIANQYSNDTQLTLAASQERTFGDATKAYIKDNYAAVQASAAVTSGTALIDVPTLISAGKLTTGFLATNAYGQSLCALVIQPTANRLQAMVVSENGQAIDDLSLGSLAAIVGGSGGGIYASDPTTIRGAIGGWSITTATFNNRVNNVNRRCDGTAGNVQLAAGHPVMALWFENGDTSSAFLARDLVPNRPELNTMNTPLTMGAGTVQTSGGACVVADLGKLARDSGGKVLMCDGSNWKTQGSAYWQDTVDTYATLTTATPCTATIAGQTRVVTTPTVKNADLTGPRAYNCNGTSWTALAVDDSGNLKLPGTLTTGKIQLNDVVTEGSACPTNGLVAKDSTGLILSCQSGAWAKQARSAAAYSGSVIPNQCWAGWIDMANNICAVGQWIVITFPQPFLTPPSMVVVVEGLNGAGSPCMTGGYDSTTSSAAYITTTGAWINAGASPIPTNCGAANGGYGQVYAKWIAVGTQ